MWNSNKRSLKIATQFPGLCFLRPCKRLWSSYLLNKTALLFVLSILQLREVLPYDDELPYVEIQDVPFFKGTFWLENKFLGLICSL